MVIRVENARADVCSLLCLVSLNEGLKRCRVTILLQVERLGTPRSAVQRGPIHLRRGPLMSQLPPSCSPDPQGLPGTCLRTALLLAEEARQAHWCAPGLL